MGFLRAFIAVDIPPALQQAIQGRIAQLRKEFDFGVIRWVDTQNLHLTLKFLGDTSSDMLPALKDGLARATAQVPIFHFEVTGHGSFPSLRRPRVLWLGIQAPAELEALNREVELVCRGLGFAVEGRGFHPHLTLGRVRQDISTAEAGKVRHALEALTIDSLGTVRVDSVQLYKSDVQRSGAVYTKLFSVPLKP